LVGLGVSNDGLTNDLEVIDLDDSGNFCENLEPFPAKNEAAVSGLLRQDGIIICGLLF
jgi:hypothetical protein